LTAKRPTIAFRVKKPKLGSQQLQQPVAFNLVGFTHTVFQFTISIHRQLYGPL
jgi:hypothetical protein